MTSAWYKKNLGDAMLAEEALTQLAAQFLATYKQAGHPDKLAVFIRHESEGRLHCEVIAYFPPDTADLANGMDADPCARPSRDGLSLLAGSESAWRTLLPESGE
jgi:hypothetical protein